MLGGSMGSREEDVERLEARVAELERTLEAYQRVFEVSPVGMSISAQDGRFIEINPSALRLFGLTRGEVIGRSSVELGLVPPESHEARAEFLRRVQEQGVVSSAERTILDSSGQLHDVALQVDRVEIQGEPGYVSTFFEITERNRILEQLAASEARYRQIVETTREGICVWDAEDRYTFMNRRYEEIFGYAPGELIGQHMLDRMDADARARAEPLIRRRNAGISEGGEFQIKRAPGEDAWIRYESSSIMDAQGRYAGAISTVLDVTERRLAEDQLRRSEAQLREAQEIAHLGSWEWDAHSNVIARSAELCRIFGKSQDEIGAGQAMPHDLIHPEDRERFGAETREALAQRKAYSIDCRIVRADGVRFLHTQGHVTYDEAGKPIRARGTVQDVTDRKQTEARLLFADRMASVGTLAAGMAHELNNPLTYVLTNLDLIAEGLRAAAGGSPGASLAEMAKLTDEARQGSERIRKIVRGLKAFSRADEEHRVLVDVRKVIDGAIDMAFNEIRHRARLVREYRDVPPVEADESNLAQVFINLLVNAAQAIPEGQADRNEILVATGRDGAGRVLVEVRDTGPGMSREVLGRIFDPFFTTKPVGVGTGLGLSICHGIITALGGEITVESQVGQGTVFRIALPPAQPAEVKPVEVKPAAAPVVRRGRILVVDDDAMVGTALRRILKDHDVTVINDAREARDRIAAGERYDLVLCDLMMPEMTGMDLHAELTRTQPEQADRMIFVTGGAFTQTAVEFLARVPNERLDKPFDARNLRALVQRLLA
jgi:PAS domain S-box-containing protein